MRDSGAKEVQDLVALGARALPVAEAATSAEVVVFAIPAGAVVQTAKALGNLEGGVVVDCTNAIAKGFTLVAQRQVGLERQLPLHRGVSGAHDAGEVVVEEFLRSQLGGRSWKTPMERSTSVRSARWSCRPRSCYTLGSASHVAGGVPRRRSRPEGGTSGKTMASRSTSVSRIQTAGCGALALL